MLVSLQDSLDELKGKFAFTGIVDHEESWKSLFGKKDPKIVYAELSQGLTGDVKVTLSGNNNLLKLEIRRYDTENAHLLSESVITFSNQFHTSTIEDVQVFEGHKSGIARTIIKNVSKLWDEFGTKKIDVNAGKSVGGYAWLRFGFLPGNIPDLKAYVTKKITPELEAQHPKTIEYVKLAMSTGRPEAFRFISGLQAAVMIEDKNGEQVNLKVGQALLLGSNWKGNLDLNNPTSRQMLNDYINTKPKGLAL